MFLIISFVLNSEIFFTGLPFICECDLQWFKKWLKKRKLLEDSGATCIFPIPLSKFSETNFCLDGYEEDAVEIEDDDEDEEDTDEPDTGNKEEL